MESDQAANGMRNNDPDKFGIATNNPSIKSVTPALFNMGSRILEVAPKATTAVNPIKNPSVEPKIPFLGFPLIMC